jgi:hypothetical protein
MRWYSNTNNPINLSKIIGVVKLKDDPNQLGTEITLIARIALHLSYSDLTTPILMNSEIDILNLN